jgi:hypothetical protein
VSAFVPRDRDKKSVGLCFFGVSRDDSHKAFEALSGREQTNDYQVTDENDLPKSIGFASVPRREFDNVLVALVVPFLASSDSDI